MAYVGRLGNNSVSVLSETGDGTERVFSSKKKNVDSEYRDARIVKSRRWRLKTGKH